MSPLLLPLVPLGTAAAVVALRRWPRLGPSVALGGLVAAVAVGAWAAAAEPVLTVAWSPVVQLSLRVEGFARVMVVLVPLVATPIVAYAAATETEGRARLLSLLLVFVAAMLLLVVAGDFITLLIAWELVGAVSWMLIGHAWRDRANVEAATRAFVTTRVGDLGLYVAAGAAFAASGSFAYSSLQGVHSPWLGLVAAGVLLAAAAKSAQVPFSPWLFAAMAGPTPVSALLHSAALVAAGAYLMVRLAPLLEPVEWFLPAAATVGIVTALAGGIVATVQTHAKRVLAASTSAQYGLMFVAVGAGSTAAAGAHLVTHAAFKSLLFLGAGVAIHATGTAILGRRRLGRSLPLVAALTGVGVLALAAVPPLGGAWTKDAVLAAAVEASPALGLATFAAAFLTALYAGRFQLLTFGRSDDRASSLVGHPSRAEVASLALLASLTVALGVLWLPGAPSIVEALTGGPVEPGAAWELALALGLVGIAGSALLLLDRRGHLIDLGLGGSARDRLADWLGLAGATDRLVTGPVLRLAFALARADDRLIDAGVRAAGRIGLIAAGLLSTRVEISFDGVVRAASSAALWTAGVSRLADDAAVDRAVEASARGIGNGGRHSRRLQTGLAHHYYVIVVIGLGLIAIVLAVAR